MILIRQDSGSELPRVRRVRRLRQVIEICQLQRTSFLATVSIAQSQMSSPSPSAQADYTYAAEDGNYDRSSKHTADDASQVLVA